MRPLLTMVVLLALVVASALAVVQKTHESRLMFREMERLTKEWDEARAEETRLKLEQASQSDASAIERIAQEELGMRAPETINLLVLENE